MAWWKTAAGATTRAATSSGAQEMRDAAYSFAGKGIRKSARNVDDAAQRQRGRRRLAYGGAGFVGSRIVSSGRGSTGRDGIQPHSMGGTTI